MTVYEFILRNFKSDVYLRQNLGKDIGEAASWSTDHLVYYVPRGWACMISKANGYASGLDRIDYETGRPEPEVYCYAPIHYVVNSEVEPMFIPLKEILAMKEVAEGWARITHPALFQALEDRPPAHPRVRIEPGEPESEPAPRQRLIDLSGITEYAAMPAPLVYDAITAQPELSDKMLETAKKDVVFEQFTYAGNCKDPNITEGEHTTPIAKVRVFNQLCGWVYVQLGGELGNNDAERTCPEIAIERRPGGWALIIAGEGGEEDSGIVYILDSGESYVMLEQYGERKMRLINSPNQIPELEQFPKDVVVRAID